MIDIDDLLKEDNFLIELKQIKYPTKNKNNKRMSKRNIYF